MGAFDPLQNCKGLAIEYRNEEFLNGYLQNKHKNADVKTQKVKKTLNIGSIILGQVTDSLIKIKHSKDMTARDMPLIQMSADGLTFLTW